MRNGLSDMPDQYYEAAGELADRLLVIVQGEMQELAEQHDLPTALGIGGVAMTYLICGLGDTYESMMDLEVDDAARAELGNTVIEGLNKRLVKVVARSNGELN